MGVMSRQYHSDDGYLACHQITTAHFGVLLYDCLPGLLKAGLPGNAREILDFALSIHDISKTPENGWTHDLLFGPRHPTREEWFNVIIPHPTQARQILEKRGVKDPLVLAIVHHHHVREDGAYVTSIDGNGRTMPPYAGYPDGPIGSELSILERIAKLADAISAMYEDRPYRKEIFTTAKIKGQVKERGREMGREKWGAEYARILSEILQGIPDEILESVRDGKGEYEITPEEAIKNIETRNGKGPIDSRFT